VAAETCVSDRCVPRGDGGLRQDGGVRQDGGSSGGAVGDACTRDDQCADGTCDLDLPGGYCTLSGCNGGAACPGGSTCFDLQSGGSMCIKDCSAASECRESEGYTCDSDNTCWPGSGGSTPIGGACQSSDDCASGATCYPETYQQQPTGFVGGYCMKFDCTSGSCPSGSTCIQVNTDTAACLANCDSGSPCRAGYHCVPPRTGSPNACWPGCSGSGQGDCPATYTCDATEAICISPAATCSTQNPTGPCPAGKICNNGTCEDYVCTDQRFEPNESFGAAVTAPSGSTTGIDLCANDQDWYKMSVSPGNIGTLGITFPRTTGDLDLTAYTSTGACLGGRVQDGACTWTYRDYETGEEFLSVLNGGSSGSKDFAWLVKGNQGAVNRYTLEAKLTPWTDGRDCGSPYTTQQCIGGGSTANLDLIQFPYPDPNDGYVGDGYRFDSVSNYRWLRREAIMLIRYAIKETQAKFAGTKPIGLIDMCQHNGITPGYDVDDPRHPESTHDQGGNVDVAYYTTLASEGSLAYNEARVICDANEGSTDGYYCNASAAQTHVVDLPRHVYFMAKLYESSRVRVIGADQVIAPLLQQEANRQYGLGWISLASKNAFSSKLAFGDGWPFHHHHIHVSFNWWGQQKPNLTPEAGCGFDLKKYRARAAGALRR
jgi:hypothetical protein